MGSTHTSVPPNSGAAGSAASPHPILSFFPMLVVLGILYLLVIRPQQRQAREHRKMIENLKVGDRVLTQGGIYGTVSGLKGNVVQIRIADNVRIDLSRGAVTQVVNDPSAVSNPPSGDLVR